ncbi:MAG: glucose-1-phosphate adenylyltransferase [Lachnospiraceae bacterium]|nr:glucose-1-phosphate adenylyltransferase [Lachnospiraceae bacterium]MBR0091293.1 glucose-1-phosphate adenylyltransferase [Lachnospiraceae bacterium]
MKRNNMIAMILAGGRGSRLYDLTNKLAKPAVSYGGKYRIIDFPLSNCANSGIDVIGVLTQYESIFLNSYVTVDSRWGLDSNDAGIYVLPPREKAGENLNIYRGTADAITQNIDFIDNENPDFVLILSGDHIYKMNYDKMLREHISSFADASIAVIDVPKQEASRFGIMNADATGRILEFEEKPAHPKSTLASMGIYIFNWKLLRKLLIADDKNNKSSHDFGKDLIPQMLKDNRILHAYKFKGYWKDVGTIDSLWEANMDLLDPQTELNLNDETWKIYTEDTNDLPQYMGPEAVIKKAYITQGCVVEGEVTGSILFTGVKVGKGAKIIDSVLMPGVVIEEGAVITRALVADGVRIAKNTVAGKAGSEHITLVASDIKEEPKETPKESAKESVKDGKDSKDNKSAKDVRPAKESVSVKEERSAKK